MLGVDVDGNDIEIDVCISPDSGTWREPLI